MKKIDGNWERTSWEQALTEIAAKLGELSERYDPSVNAFFCGSIGVENVEMVSLTQRFKAALKTPNYFSVESICYRMRIRARQITFGKYPVEGLDSRLYLLWGHNPDASDFPLSLAIEENIRKGAKVIVIDPRRIPIANRAEMYLPIRPGTERSPLTCPYKCCYRRKIFMTPGLLKNGHSALINLYLTSKNIPRNGLKT